MKFSYSHKILVALIFSLCSLTSYANSAQQIAEQKITELKELIKLAEKQGIDAEKEKMSIRTAEVYLGYANWDDNNLDANIAYFKQVAIYKKTAVKMANELPEFERQDIIKMLDRSINTLTQLQQKTRVRKTTPKIDWAGITHQGDQLIYQNAPVFIADWSWKPKIPSLTEYYGQLNNFFITPGYVNNAEGSVSANIKKGIVKNKSQDPGFIFINNGNLPSWVNGAYGADFTEFQAPPYTDYDIDHPKARELISKLFAGFIPALAGTRMTELGYMLCNEPRFITYKNGDKKVWYRDDISPYTLAKFTSWLTKKHQTISQLNTRWKSNFTDFNQVTQQWELQLSERGGAKWYDWTTFNEERVTQWFQFMKDELLKHDPAAKVHLKIIPEFFTGNEPDTGIDLEALTKLSAIIGNDIAASNNNMRKPTPWKTDYAWDWRELYMGYDFMKSVSPEKMLFNTESHLLSAAHTRDLYLSPEYVRSSFWAAHTLGLNASQIWYWPRREDGSVRKHNDTNGYAGSNSHQPRVVNEVHATIMDLNSYSEDIVAMQRLRKPIRIFYSKTSANNHEHYMDGLYEVYQQLNFEGLPLGFVTKDILTEQSADLWDVVLVHKTEQVTAQELSAIQEHLNQGGTVITDNASLQSNQYGEPLAKLVAAKGKLISVNDLTEMSAKALNQVQANNALPAITLVEKNSGQRKGCNWRLVKNAKGNYVLSIINLGSTAANITVTFNDGNSEPVVNDLLKGQLLTNLPTIQPNEVYLLELKRQK